MPQLLFPVGVFYVYPCGFSLSGLLSKMVFLPE